MTYALHALVIVAAGLGGPALLLAPVWIAYKLGRGAARRRAMERTRAQVAHIGAVARERLADQSAQQTATAAAIAELEADDCWLEIQAADENADSIAPASREEGALHMSRTCRDLAPQEGEPDRSAPPPVPTLAVAAPDDLLAALWQAARANVPDPMRAQPGVVVAATHALVGEILDGVGISERHPGRRNAERAVLMAFSFSAAPHKIGRS